LVQREVIGRYRGSVMGLMWSFFNPLLMLAVYTFVFGVVFKTRWGVNVDSKSEFAMVLFAGLIVYTLFAECINRAPGLILSNVNYVKKVVFPLEILPWVTMASALFHTFVSLLVLILFYAMANLSLNWTIIFVPLILLPFTLLTLAATWFLSALGVFLRDVSQTVGVITTALLFLSPVFYPVSALPEEYRWCLYANPLTFIIEEVRDTLIFGNQPDWQGLAVYFVLSLLAAWAGFAWFQKSRRGFADVL
jgi:lipopolysaccharide transport system permease protein